VKQKFGRGDKAKRPGERHLPANYHPRAWTGQDGSALERPTSLTWLVVAVHRKSVGCAQNGGSAREL
jgi:hypothetical protein